MSLAEYLLITHTQHLGAAASRLDMAPMLPGLFCRTILAHMCHMHTCVLNQLAFQSAGTAWESHKQVHGRRRSRS